MIQYGKKIVAQNLALAGSGKRPIAVKELLEWAFAREKAQLDFDRPGAGSGGVDTIWMLMQRGRLGCKVDGGRGVGGWDGDGQSDGDAQVVASIVAALPVQYGGRGMAVRMAELARACMVPDFYPDDTPVVRPVGWKNTKHGRFAITEDARDVRFAGFGRFCAKDSRACPVSITPTVQTIAAARRFYLDWIGALMHVQVELSRADLDRWDVTNHLPPLRPWVKGD